MKSEWQEKFLSEIADIQTGPFGSQLHKNDYVDFGTPIVTVEHLGEKQFSTQNLPKVSDIDKIRLNKYILAEGDMVFSRVGSVDRCSYVDAKYDGWMFSGRCLRVRPNSNIVDAEFLYYYFTTESVKQYIRNIAVGATMPSINTRLISEVKVLVPNLAEQRVISAILSALDARIANNNAINHHLEQMAQAIYAQFFPYDDSPTMPIGELIDVRDGTHDSPKPVEHGFPLVTSKHLLPYGLDLASPNRISKADFDKVNERSKVDRHDILISMIGTIGLISLVTERKINFAIKNVGLFKTSQSEDWIYFVLCFLRSPEIKNHIDMRLAGSTQKYISLGELRQLPLVKPDSVKLRDFNDSVRTLFEKITLNTEESTRLTVLRDTLLPRLMSGELSVAAK